MVGLRSAAATRRIYLGGNMVIKELIEKLEEIKKVDSNTKVRIRYDMYATRDIEEVVVTKLDESYGPIVEIIAYP